MTEIPEHLLKRSRERRAAMGGDGDGGETPAAAPSGDASPVPAAAAPATPAPKKAATPAAPPPPKPVPAYVAAARTRKKVPFWALPVVAALPIWLFIYAEAMSPPEVVLTGPLAGGEEIFGKCTSCHGGTGGGTTAAPQLNNGEVLLTFPDFASHYSFVATGSQPWAGLPYGDPNRPGGQAVGRVGMPAWDENLTAAEIMEVVCHERYTLQGNDGTENPAQLEEFATYCAPDAPEFVLAEEEGAEYELFANPHLPES